MSEHMISVAPKVSAEESFLMRALRFASSRAPRARDTVTTAGKPSGTAETASAIAVSNASIISPIPLVPRINSSYSSSMKMMAQTLMKLVGHVFKLNNGIM